MLRIIIPAAFSIIAPGFVLWLLFNKRQKPWEEMSIDERKKKKVMLYSGLAVFIAGLVTALVIGKKEKE
jgi:hypothetical protein